MPGCVLHVTGKDFNPDVFLGASSLTAYKVFHRGEPKAKVGPRAKKFWEYSGFSSDVSKVDGDLRGEIADAIEFLMRHREDFIRIQLSNEVDDCRLDFGIYSRIDGNIVVQGEWIPVEFSALVGELGVGVAISIYPPRPGAGEAFGPPPRE
jgi:hypothetical protein